MVGADAGQVMHRVVVCTGRIWSLAHWAGCRGVLPALGVSTMNCMPVSSKLLNSFSAAAVVAITSPPPVIFPAHPGVVDAVLIPEVPFTIKGNNGLFKYLEGVLEKKGHCVVCVAEGAGQVRDGRWHSDANFNWWPAPMAVHATAGCRKVLTRCHHRATSGWLVAKSCGACGGGMQRTVA